MVLILPEMVRVYHILLSKLISHCNKLLLVRRIRTDFYIDLVEDIVYRHKDPVINNESKHDYNVLDK